MRTLNELLICSEGAVVTALGSMAVKECQFMEWADAVAALISIEKWMMAMHLLVAFYCQASGQSYFPKHSRLDRPQVLNTRAFIVSGSHIWEQGTLP